MAVMKSSWKRYVEAMVSRCQRRGRDVVIDYIGERYMAE